ncbi:unnamed protein product, partial [Ixodes hexagonus]
YRCTICGYSSDRRWNMSMHVQRHTGDWPFRCDVCARSFMRKYLLQQHVCTYRSGKRPHEPFVCAQAVTDGRRDTEVGVCSKTFLSKNKLSGCMLVEKSRLLRCRFCSYTALYHSLLMRHERIHTGDRPYECAVCSKRFVQKTHLENHMRMHSGERPFRCEHCPKSFVTSSGLAGHALSHASSDALYKCDQCAMVF